MMKREVNKLIDSNICIHQMFIRHILLMKRGSRSAYPFSFGEYSDESVMRIYNIVY